MPLFCEAFAPEARSMDAAARAVVGAAENTLLAALHPQVALAVWLREEPRHFARSLRPMREGGAFRATGEGPPEAALDGLCTQLPDGAPAEFLTDIFRLATLFGALTRSETVRLRLEGITGDACRKFHVDAVGYRMLVTYAGPGTQWVMGDDPEIAASPEQIPRCAVALFRGRRRPGGHALHRSPPLSDLPEAQRWRLLLCIDEPEPTP
ncbi:DUF1826 domain-containing protein [Roseococcus pinisoli]|uniref:DUF1826 domain-containing protein n=1 Tax=Roseococcus pinisoli TaxID=2835040 RepID=A0ABS5QG71_9PROT|nr:DUF1826 domain-containing protein [Roseococcus pinisoli]MBS7812686.1 DUF1826 domain-containing protein [Roseococcus pinisoli]